MNIFKGFVNKGMYILLAVFLLLISIGLLAMYRLYSINSNKKMAAPSTGSGTSTSYPYFVPGKTVVVRSIRVGPAGGTLTVDNTGTPADGVVVVVHKGALSQEVTLSLGYNDGKLENLQEGKASGKTLVLSTVPQVDFAVATDGNAVQITVPYTASPKPKVIAPYAIDEKNRLQPLQLEAIDEATSHARFATFHPVMFTWVYVY
jgi:hypothetical protein